MDKVFICRPDDNHWCVECCHTCISGFLGDTGDGKIGCLVQSKKAVSDEFSTCREWDCLSFAENQEEKEKIRQTIIKLPTGQFKMSEVLRKLNYSYNVYCFILGDW